MDIGLIAPPWLPVPAPAYGGTENVIAKLATGLRDAGHNVLLVCHPESTVDVERASVVPAQDATRMGRASIELEHVIGAYELVRHCDVVHDHTLVGPHVSERVPHLPVVATNHMPFTRTMTAIFSSLPPQAALTAISHAQARSTNLQIDAVIHHGIDLTEFPQGGGRGGHLAVLGRMAPEKGIHRAIALAKAAGMPLYIAAKMREPNERAYFDKQVRPHLDDQIRYLGEIGHAGKVALLGTASALLNPIQWPEPFGMVMLEALACGTPVIGCPAGAAPEIVDHGRTGFLFDTDAELVSALQGITALDRDECRRQAASRFSVEEMTSKYVDVYERVRRRGRHRRRQAAVRGLSPRRPR